MGEASHHRVSISYGVPMNRDDGLHYGPRVTMEDVARHAEVSRALVSIVMRGVPGASDETRARVFESARVLGYRPDLRARALAGQRSRTIGVMFGVTVGVFHFQLLDGLYEAAEARSHSLILSPLTRRRDERQAAQALQDFRFDSLIMLNPPTLHPILAGRLPLAVIGWHIDHPDVDVVRVSDDQGIAAMVDHLVALGHRRIAHIDGGATVISDSRRTAYTAAMTRHGLGSEVRVVTGGQSQLDGWRAAQRLLDEGDLPTAVVAYNDDTAVAAISLFRQQGISVPNQLSVTGFDDSEIAELSPVPLTTVAQDPTELGRRAIDRVIARVEQQRIPDREIVLDGEVRVRSSTARPRAS